MTSPDGHGAVPRRRPSWRRPQDSYYAGIARTQVRRTQALHRDSDEIPCIHGRHDTSYVLTVQLERELKRFTRTNLIERLEAAPYIQAVNIHGAKLLCSIDLTQSPYDRDDFVIEVLDWIRSQIDHSTYGFASAA